MVQAQPYKGASDDAITHHYDVGNDFYRLWLDSSMTYSAALWKNSEDDLESAQTAKLDYHIESAHAADADRVLDIGCGWGGLLMRLTKCHHVKRAVGLTLSPAQAQAIKELQQPGVDVYYQNWLDHKPESVYDAIISIGAFEHFATPGLSSSEKIAAYRAFFKHCHQILCPGGFMSLQTVIYENADAGHINQFLGQEIFPDSELPRLSEIVAATDRLFEIVLLRNEGKHYEKTLRCWLKNLRARSREAVELVGEEKVAKYVKYFSLCMIGFHQRALNLSRIALRRID